jgi:WD40 repeat protein
VGLPGGPGAAIGEPAGARDIPGMPGARAPKPPQPPETKFTVVTGIPTSGVAQRVINETKLRVLQQELQTTLAELGKIETSLRDAPAETRDALGAKTKVLREFAGKLEGEIRQLDQRALPPAKSQAPHAVDFRTLPEAQRLPQFTSTTSQTLSIFHVLDPDTATATSADGKRIVLANSHPSYPVVEGMPFGMKILDTTTGAVIATQRLTTADEERQIQGFRSFQVRAAAFSPDASMVAVGTSVGQVKIFDARTGEFLNTLDDEKARLEAKDMPEMLQSFKRALGGVMSLAFSPDGTLLATCGGGEMDNLYVPNRSGFKISSPGRLKVWEVKTGRLKYDFPVHGEACATAFSPDGRMLATGGSSTDAAQNGVVIRDASSGAVLSTIPVEGNRGSPRVVFSPDSRLLAFESWKANPKNFRENTTTIGVAHPETGKVEWRQLFTDWAGVVGFEPDGSLAVRTDALEIQFLDGKTGTKVGGLHADEGHGGGCIGYGISGDRHTLVIGGRGPEADERIHILTPEKSQGARPAAPAPAGSPGFDAPSPGKVKGQGAIPGF